MGGSCNLSGPTKGSEMHLVPVQMGLGTSLYSFQVVYSCDLETDLLTGDPIGDLIPGKLLDLVSSCLNPWNVLTANLLHGLIRLADILLSVLSACFRAYSHSSWAIPSNGGDRVPPSSTSKQQPSCCAFSGEREAAFDWEGRPSQQKELLSAPRHLCEENWIPPVSKFPLCASPGTLPPSLSVTHLLLWSSLGLVWLLRDHSSWTFDQSTIGGPSDNRHSEGHLFCTPYPLTTPLLRAFGNACNGGALGKLPV